VLGRCWESAPPRLNEQLVLAALNVDRPAVAAVLGELDVSVPMLRDTIAAGLRIAS
jgi:hypothetical protein